MSTSCRVPRNGYLVFFQAHHYKEYITIYSTSAYTRSIIALSLPLFSFIQPSKKTDGNSGSNPEVPVFFIISNVWGVKGWRSLIVKAYYLHTFLVYLLTYHSWKVRISQLSVGIPLLLGRFDLNFCQIPQL